MDSGRRVGDELGGGNRHVDAAMCKTASGNLLSPRAGSSAQCPVVLKGFGGGGWFMREGIYVYIQVVQFIQQEQT